MHIALAMCNFICGGEHRQSILYGLSPIGKEIEWSAHCNVFEKDHPHLINIIGGNATYNSQMYPCGPIHTGPHTHSGSTCHIASCGQRACSKYLVLPRFAFSVLSPHLKIFVQWAPAKTCISGHV